MLAREGRSLGRVRSKVPLPSLRLLRKGLSFFSYRMAPSVCRCRRVTHVCSSREIWGRPGYERQARKGPSRSSWSQATPLNEWTPRWRTIIIFLAATREMGMVLFIHHP